MSAMLVAGILVTYVPFFHRGRAGHLLFHMRLGHFLYPPGKQKPRTVVSWFSLTSVPLVREMVELSQISVGEFVVLVCLLAETAVWFWFGWLTGMEKNHSALRCGVIATGKVIQWILILMFIPVARNSLLRMLFGIGFERSIKFHRWLSILFWLTSTVHSVLWVAEMYRQGNIRWTGRTKSGLPTWIVMTLVVFVAMEPVRRRFYAMFKYVHVLGTIASMVLLLWHEKWTRSIPFVALGLGPLIVDYLLRIITPMGGLMWPASIVDMRYDVENEIVKLVIERPLWLWQSIAGAYVMLWVPRANPFLGHPVTIIPEIQEDYTCDGSLLEEGSVAHRVDDEEPLQGDMDSAFVGKKGTRTRFLSSRFTVYLKKRGGFTKRLAKLAQKAERGDLNPRDLLVRLEGPYASTPIHFDVLVLVAGGIGITPMLGILAHVVQRSDLPIKKILLLWTCRNKSMVDKFSPTITRLLRQRKWCEKLREGTTAVKPNPKTPLLLESPISNGHDSHDDHPPPLVEMDIYITAESEDPSSCEGSSRFTCSGGSCQTALATWTYGRRPDIGKWIKDLDKKYDIVRESQSIGVSCCGTRSMIDDVSRACSLQPKFSVYPEEFDW